jgi:hypothetical protein
MKLNYIFKERLAHPLGVQINDKERILENVFNLCVTDDHG